MKRILLYLLSGATCLLLLGCTHTVISGGGDEHWSPAGGRYHVGISAHGASGRAYTDLTDKRIDLSITAVGHRNELTTLLRRDIRLRAADLAWRVRWQGSRAVRVTFTGDHPAPTNSKGIVAIYSFTYDATTNSFVESRHQ